MVLLDKEVMVLPAILFYFLFLLIFVQCPPNMGEVCLSIVAESKLSIKPSDQKPKAPVCSINNDVCTFFPSFLIYSWEVSVNTNVYIKIPKSATLYLRYSGEYDVHL